MLFPILGAFEKTDPLKFIKTGSFQGASFALYWLHLNGKEAVLMQKGFSTRRLALAGMMAAVVFAGNYARIVIPISLGGQTAFTLGNIFSCLSGLLLGPVGGLSSGIGAALYDLMDPRYAADCWITFLTKGAMGLAAGLVALGGLKKDRLTYGRALGASVAGCLTY